MSTAPAEGPARREFSLVSHGGRSHSIEQEAFLRRPIDNLDAAMAQAFNPRLSEAMHLLPLLRSYLNFAASTIPLSTALALDLVPIAENGLFGYELVPDRETPTYVTVGCNAHWEPVMRVTLYNVDASPVVRLAAVDGHALSRSERAARYCTQQRDSCFPDWTAAAEAALTQLLALFPERPRRPLALGQSGLRCLEEALAVAHSHLRLWNPFIRFCGVPNEAQQGFALGGAYGEHGELIFQRPDIWILRWKAPPRAVYESWSIALTDLDATSNAARGDRAS